MTTRVVPFRRQRFGRAGDIAHPPVWQSATSALRRECDCSAIRLPGGLRSSFLFIISGFTMLHLMQSGAAHMQVAPGQPVSMRRLSFTRNRLRAGLAPVISRLFGVVCNARCSGLQRSLLLHCRSSAVFLVIRLPACAARDASGTSSAAAGNNHTAITPVILVRTASVSGRCLLSFPFLSVNRMKRPVEPQPSKDNLGVDGGLISANEGQRARPRDGLRTARHLQLAEDVIEMLLRCPP